MTEFLIPLGAHALGGTVAVIVLVVISRIKWIGLTAKWRCIAWLLLCFRLLIPISLPFWSPIQLPAIYGGTTAGTSLPHEDLSGGSSIPESPVQTLFPSQSGTPGSVDKPAQAAGSHAGFGAAVPRIIFFIWLFGVVIMILWLLVRHLRFLHYVHRWAAAPDDSKLVTEFNRIGDELGLYHRPKLLLCPDLPSPVIVGPAPSILLLPADLPSQTTLRYALLHELTHYRRKDTWIKACAIIVNAIYWFDPFMWCLVRLVEQDIELACDEDVLLHLPNNQYKAYGFAVLAAYSRTP